MQCHDARRLSGHDRRELWGVGLTLLAGLLFAAATTAHAASFSAQSVETAPQQAAKEGQLFVADERMRWEVNADGRQRIQIVDPEEQAAWVLLPEQKAYFEVPLPPNIQGLGSQRERPVPCDQENISCERAGVETLNGREAVKWSVQVPAQGRPMQAAIWLDSVHGFPVREEVAGKVISEWRFLGTEQVSGRTTEKWQRTFQGPGGEAARVLQWYDPQLKIAIRQQMPGGHLRELRNIAVAPQPESLFEVPEGYQKLQPPAGASPQAPGNRAPAPTR